MGELGRAQKCRFLDVSRCGGRLTVSVQRCFKEHVGLRVRRREARRRMKTYLSYLGPMTWSDAEAAFTIQSCNASVAAIESVLADIDSAFDAISRRSLPPDVVDEILGITAQERLRWTKDQRLRTSGSQLVSRGQRITLPLYPVNEIEQLLHDPTIIQAWREADRAASLGM